MNRIRIRIANDSESQLGSFRVRNDLSSGLGVWVGWEGEKEGWGFCGELAPP